MNTNPLHMNQNEAVTSEDLLRGRVMACYRRAGGPLLGWLVSEAKKRGHTAIVMSENLGVTVGYLHQLKTGHRKIAHISDAFAISCARYLGVPPIVVKLLAGRVCISDFLAPAASETEVLERGFREMLDDPVVRQLLPADLDKLSPEGRKALVLMYAEVTHVDLFDARELPGMLRYLQSAAQVHARNEQEAHQELFGQCVAAVA